MIEGAGVFLGIFIITILLIFLGPIITEKFQPKIKGRIIPIDHGTVPLFMVGISFLIGMISLNIIKEGFIGKPPLEPYTIVIFFFSFAYLCISLDQTGLFKYIALLLIKKSGGSGVRLFNIIFIMSSVLTIFTSNDIVIMTITPIAVNVIKETKIKGLPFLIAQFFAANIWSMFLIIGNPTNIIVGLANDIDFFEYLQLMFLPTILGGITCYFILRIIFSKDISITFQQIEIDALSAFSDKKGAKILTPLFFLCILFLSISDYLNFKMWIIALIFATLAFSLDSIRFLNAKRKNIITKVPKKDPSKVSNPDLRIIYKRLPYKILPFTISFFIFVEGLKYYGFTALLATFLSGMTGNVFQNVLVGSLSSTLFANIMNNQPMTVLFTKTLNDPILLGTGIEYEALLYGLIIGSNLGANITFFGALAGLMWRKMLSDMGEKVQLSIFFKTGIKTILPVIFITSITLAIMLSLK